MDLIIVLSFHPIKFHGNEPESTFPGERISAADALRVASV
jgi:hypothetical protein